jgi:phosphoribosyl 1,2-cyclic phosphodiesterase
MLAIDYDMDILRENIEHAGIDLSRAKRTVKSHMSLNTAIEFLKANDLSKLKEVHLLHLSDSNSDEARFKDETQKLTGVPVYVG